MFAWRAELARRADRHGVFLTLSQCLDRSNVASVGEMVPWFAEHASAVGQCLWILRRSLVLAPDAPPRDEAQITLCELQQALQHGVPGLRFAAWLGSDADDTSAKWLQAMRFVLNGQTLGWVDARFVEAVQTLSHWFTGRYVGIQDKRKQSLRWPVLLFMGLFNRSLRSMAWRWLALALRKPHWLFAKAHLQAFTVVDPPSLVNGRRDLCDGCPDAILHHGKLVPSCCLAEIELYGQPFQESQSIQGVESER